MKNKLKRIFGQPSWRVTTRGVDAYVTETGGHLGPVTFRIGGKEIQPFAIAPWAEETVPETFPALLKVLRGDFFCMPFGNNTRAFKGEHHPPHGETANARWRFESTGAGSLHLSLKPKVRSGRVDKHIFLCPGHTAIYQRHIISGMTGPMCFGHHPILRFPDAPGSGRLSTSGFLRGHVAPVPFEEPEKHGYCCLMSGSEFRSLEKVRMQDGGYADLSDYPARRGFEDLVVLETDPRPALAWSAVTFPTERYVWFTLKDSRVLRYTVLWLSNGGRYYAPWNGRHVNVMGVEEVTSYFQYGLADSAEENPLTRKGKPTCHRFHAGKPLAVNFVMAVAAIPAGFDRVKTIIPEPNRHSVLLTSHSGKSVSVPLALEFLETNPDGNSSSPFELRSEQHETC